MEGQMNIKHLKIELEEYKIVNSEYTHQLENLSKINIFIGKNNSGKSRFMRSIFFINNNYKLEFLPNDELFDKFIKQANKFKDPLVEQKARNYSNRYYVYSNIEKYIEEIEYLKESETPFPNLKKLYINYKNNQVKQGTQRYLKEYFEEYFDGIPLEKELFNYDFYKIYIPSLRGLIPVTPKEYLKEEYLKTDLYAERTKKDYFGENSKILTDINEFIMDSDSKTKNAIITGMQFYENVKNYLLGDLEQRKIISDYEKYLSETFFDNEEVVIIPKINDDVLTVRIGEEEYKIYELGDGIQSIILITLPLFLYLDKVRENTCILAFIEEPEVGLHPKLQRKLIKTFLDDKFENYQFFFTTHSNHFIDQILIGEEISTYFVEKIDLNNQNTPEFNIRYINNEYLDIIKKLGVLPSSSLMANCTILVEGVTDLYHFKNYLKLYQEQMFNNKLKFEEGIHYSFLIAGGDESKNTIKNLNEIQKEKILFITDYDDEKKSNNKLEFFEENNFKNYHILEVTEVENLVSKSIILKTLEKIQRKDGIYITKTFTQDDYTKSEDFREFIVDKIFNGKAPKRLAKKKKLKKQICKTEINNTEIYDELTKEAKKVAKIIYDFIKDNN